LETFASFLIEFKRHTLLEFILNYRVTFEFHHVLL